MPFDQPFRHLVNPRSGVPGLVTLNAAGYRRARAEITGWAGYAITPLVALPTVAQQAKVQTIHIKDEQSRFGLGSFKALGGAYAVLGVLRAELARSGAALHATTQDLMDRRYAEASRAITVCCATDGNHGRSVAWGAARFGASCCIFVHSGVSAGRVEAIAAYGAEVRRVPGNYDDAVRVSAETAAQNGWFIVSDTSYAGYTEIPREVMQGYRLMVDEAFGQLPAPPTHVLIQAGVGGVAASVSVQMRAQVRAPAHAEARLVIVEPDQAACLFASAGSGKPTAISGALDTIMAGLACGEPSLLAWQELDRSAAAFLSIPDEAAVEAMRTLAALGIESGESGAAGLAGLMLAAGNANARAALGLDESSRVLLFSTEGATDPALYAKLVGA